MLGFWINNTSNINILIKQKKNFKIYRPVFNIASLFTIESADDFRNALSH